LSGLPAAVDWLDAVSHSLSAAPEFSTQIAGHR